jgi:hypothetical protein
MMMLQSNLNRSSASNGAAALGTLSLLNVLEALTNFRRSYRRDVEIPENADTVQTVTDSNVVVN